MPISKVASAALSAGAAEGAAVAGGHATAAATATAHLLGAAGVTTSVPVAGWLVAGGLAAAAGTISLVHAIRAGKVRRAEAVEHARSMGVANANQAPAFVVHALKKGSAWRQKQANKLARGHVSTKDRAKLSILAAVDLSERAAARGHLEPSVPPAMLVAEHGSSDPESSIASWAIVGGVVLLVALGATLVKRKRAGA